MGPPRRRARASQAIRRRGKGTLEDALTLASARAQGAPRPFRRAGLFAMRGGCVFSLLKGLVPALIVKRAGRGTEHFAEILGVGPDLVAVDGLLVPPHFDD